MALRKRDICGRLGQNEPFGPTDVCKLPPDHQGPHMGRYRGMEWEDIEGKPHKAKIQHPGGGVPPGGNIRGN